MTFSHPQINVYASPLWAQCIDDSAKLSDCFHEKLSDFLYQKLSDCFLSKVVWLFSPKVVWLFSPKVVWLFLPKVVWLFLPKGPHWGSLARGLPSCSSSNGCCWDVTCKYFRQSSKYIQGKTKCLIHCWPTCRWALAREALACPPPPTTWRCRPPWTLAVARCRASAGRPTSRCRRPPPPPQHQVVCPLLLPTTQMSPVYTGIEIVVIPCQKHGFCT